MAEGFALGAYQFAKYRSKPTPNRIERVSVVGGGGARATAALQRGARVAEAVAVARDLVNEPGGSLTPPAFAEAISDIAARSGLKVKVLDEKAIAKARHAGSLP